MGPVKFHEGYPERKAEKREFDGGLAIRRINQHLALSLRKNRHNFLPKRRPLRLI